jgi:hypothetical protein
MDGLLKLILMLIGFALISFALLDVYLTVLHTRMGAAIISHRLACWTWYGFKTISRFAGRYRESLLSYCGATVLVLLVFTWLGLLMVGGAMVIKPALGGAVQATQGPTPMDFSTALYVAGDAMMTVGASDFAPRTPFYRLFYTFMSVIGISVLTLTVTYFLEIYNALQARNTYVSKLHHATGDTGDAAELVAGLGSGGDFQHGYTHLVELGAETAELYEAHHFYPVLLYFRFRQPHYALARGVAVTLDTITLIKAALDDEKYAWLKESVAVTQIWNSAMRTVVELSVVFLPAGIPQEEADAATIDRWRRRYRAAVTRLQKAGIETMGDELAGEEVYVNLRARWDRYVTVFAEHMMHALDVVDPAATRPEVATERSKLTQRLRAVG